MRRKLIAGNWKMNGDLAMAMELSLACAAAAQRLPQLDLAVFPPFTLIQTVANSVAGGTLRVGGQDLSAHAKGAFTGEVSAAMLLELGASMVLIGHSERRQWHAESSALLQQKLSRALDSGLSPILCVGESLEQRERGETETVIAAQLRLLESAELHSRLDQLTIAYEPVWAIGTGLSATPEQAQAAHAHIRGIIAKLDVRISGSIRILYGGSVTPETAAGLLGREDIDGALVGGASLKADSFGAIAAAASS